MVSEGYLLDEDIEREAEMAATRYDYWANGGSS